MQYGRTISEVVVSQVVLLLAFLFAPFDLVDVFGTGGAVILTSAFAMAVATVLYTRHRGRGRQRFAQKLEALRRLPVS